MILDYFRRISEIPRESGHCEKISDYIVSFAESRGLKYIRDEAYNVVIYKDALNGYESCPPLIFQGHMDMVCEKVVNSRHDFSKDALRIVEKDGYITADGTTLGADDGIAVAYMLALLDDDNLINPPLEMVFTTDEETGMLGALRFDTSCLKGKHMINLDSEEEGVFICACAGGMTGNIEIPIKRRQFRGTRIDITVSRLLGGHSGTDIDKNRANAIMLMGRILSDIKNNNIGLLDMHGGNKDNVIPNEARMSIVVSSDEADTIVDILFDEVKKLSDEISESEPDVLFTVENLLDDGNVLYDVLATDSFERLTGFLETLPNGVHVMSEDMPGMVESSSNLGIFEMTDTSVSIAVSIRSQKDDYIRYFSNELKKMSDKAKAVYSTKSAYPGWDIRKDSPFRDMLCKVYRKVSRHNAEVRSVHAGLEGGVFASKIPDMDIVSLGPDILDIHTVNERLNKASVYRIYTFLKKAVYEFAKMNRREKS